MQTAERPNRSASVTLMDLRIFTEPQQGSSYDDLLAVAQATERLGFSGFFRADHFVTGQPPWGRPGSTDAWTTLAGLARDTQRIRLGTLVTSATFRHPGVLAIQVAQVDQMSGGRVELGIGAGWNEREHNAYGIPFPSRRFDRLEEQLEIITGIWNTTDGDPFSHEGRHYTLSETPAATKPAQADLPIIIGGYGPQRTPSLTARFAAEFNLPGPRHDDVPELYGRVRNACEDHGRDPDELTYSLWATLACGATQAEFEKRAAGIGRTPEQLREKGLGGTTQEVVDVLGKLSEYGVERVYLQILDLADIDHLELVAADVAPHVS